MTDSKGRFGAHGGQYISETLMNAVDELEKAYNYYKEDEGFKRELDDLLKNTRVDRLCFIMPKI